MRRAFGILTLVLAVLPRVGRAADLTDVASSFDAGNKFDFRFRARYDHFEERAQIKREYEAAGQETIAVFKDLLYQSHRDQLALRAEIGLYHDLMLYAELPIIIEQAQSYSFDQSADVCQFSGPGSNCVNASNSTTIRDGIAPAQGYDAANRGLPVSGGGLFNGLLRGARGANSSPLDAFDTFNLGLKWAPLSQARDDTKPTWTVSAEAQISFGNIMAFDRAAPDANHAVSEGTHRLIFETALSKRYRWFEPYWGLWYLLPIARSDSLFVDYGPSQKEKDPQQQGGTVFGTEIVPYERRDKGYKVALDLRGRIEGHFAGRGYSQAWELLAGSPVLACDDAQAPYNPSCGSTAARNPYNKNPTFTGITSIENYATLGVDIAADAQIGRYFRLRTGFQYSHDQSHLITGDDIGTPENGSGRVTQASEFNPAYRPIINQVGRRYSVDNVNLYDFYLFGQVMF